MTRTATTADHDHTACRQSALATAERLCADRGLALTPIRRQVLEIIWTTHAPLGAYEILARLPRAGRPPAPMTVYRALDFLVSAGLVHRLDSLNAFVGCPQADEDHATQLLVCRSCQRVEEISDPAVSRALAHSGEDHHFAVDAPLEIKGLCADCRAAEPATAGGARRRTQRRPHA